MIPIAPYSVIINASNIQNFFFKRNSNSVTAAVMANIIHAHAAGRSGKPLPLTRCGTLTTQVVRFTNGVAEPSAFLITALSKSSFRENGKNWCSLRVVFLSEPTPSRMSFPKRAHGLFSLKAWVSSLYDGYSFPASGNDTLRPMLSSRMFLARVVQLS